MMQMYFSADLDLLVFYFILHMKDLKIDCVKGSVSVDL